MNEHVGWGECNEPQHKRGHEGEVRDVAQCWGSQAHPNLPLVLITDPLVSVPVAIGATALGLDVTKDVVIPGTELFLDWKKGGKEAAANGLHYLLKLKR
ncbi:MAG: hypothetical protein HY694_03570 [Deltaproteobacteria bacterium]|nr:hypothetical protein [Deltaproteobacteria bacterium]